MTRCESALSQRSIDPGDKVKLTSEVPSPRNSGKSYTPLASRPRLHIRPQRSPPSVSNVIGTPRWRLLTIAEVFTGVHRDLRSGKVSVESTYNRDGTHEHGTGIGIRHPGVVTIRDALEDWNERAGGGISGWSCRNSKMNALTVRFVVILEHLEIVDLQAVAGVPDGGRPLLTRSNRLDRSPAKGHGRLAG